MVSFPPWLFLALVTLFLVFSPVVLADAQHGISDNRGWRNATSGWIDGCDLRRYTATDWTSSGINKWITGELNKFNAHAREDEEFARDYLIPIYASKAASQLTACYVDRQCDIIASCDDLNPNFNRQTQEYALNAIMAMSTLNGHFGDILKATDVATIGMGIGMEALVEQFTYNDEFDQYEDGLISRPGMTTKSWMYLAGLINSIITEVKDIAAIAVPGFKDTAAPYITAAQDCFSVAYGVYLFKGTFDAEKQDKNTDHELVATRHISGALQAAYAPARNGFLNSTRQIMKGWTLENSTTNMATFLQDGLFTLPALGQAIKTQAAAEKAWYGMVIAQLYDTERIYMLQVDTLPGKSCADDDRGPRKVKVCLPEHPTEIFYVYGIPKYEERNKNRVTDVTSPPGWESFSGAGFHGITHEEIVRSSKTYWDLHNNQRNLPASPDLSLSTATPGMFKIAICNDPNGDFISSVDSKEGRSFPCQCAAKVPVASHEDDQLVNGRLAEFLVATNLRFSYDYNQQCFSKQKDRQDCKWYNDAHFQYDGPAYDHMDLIAQTGASLGAYYPGRGDPNVPKVFRNWDYCFERPREVDLRYKQCEAIVAFKDCRPGRAFGRTNIEGQPMVAQTPKFRGYGIGPSGD